jgi:hypothetical protein
VNTKFLLGSVCNRFEAVFVTCAASGLTSPLVCKRLRRQARCMATGMMRAGVQGFLNALPTSPEGVSVNSQRHARRLVLET